MSWWFGWGRRALWGPWPGRGPFSYLPPWLRPGWLFGPGACWWLFWAYPYRTPYLPTLPYMWGYPYFYPPSLTPEDERSLLEEERERLKEMLSTLEQRLKDLEEKKT